MTRNIGGLNIKAFGNKNKKNENEEKIQIKEDKKQLETYIDNVITHDQELYPFSREEMLLTDILDNYNLRSSQKKKIIKINQILGIQTSQREGRRNKKSELKSQERPYPKESSPFNKEKKKWYIQNPEPSGPFKQPLDAIGKIQIMKLQENESVIQQVRNTQQNIKESIGEMNRQLQKEQMQKQINENPRYNNQDLPLTDLNTNNQTEKQLKIKLQKMDVDDKQRSNMEQVNKQDQKNISKSNFHDDLTIQSSNQYVNIESKKQQPQIQIKFNDQQKKETPIDQIKIYKEFLKKAINDIDKLQEQSGARSLTKRENTTDMQSKMNKILQNSKSQLNFQQSRKISTDQASLITNNHKIRKLSNHQKNGQSKNVALERRALSTFNKDSQILNKQIKDLQAIQQQHKTDSMFELDSKFQKE